MKISDDELKEMLITMYQYSKKEFDKDDTNELMEGFNNAIAHVFINTFGYEELANIAMKEGAYNG